MRQDDIVEEIKKNSAAYSKSFEFDIPRIIADMKRRREELGIKTISFIGSKMLEEKK